MFKAIIITIMVGVCLGQFSGRRFPFNTRPQTRPRSQVRSPTQFQSPKFSRPIVQLLRSDVDVPKSDGSYKLSFASEDGISREERGQVKGHDNMEIVGSYSYISPEGVQVDVNYIADEFGFRAESPNLPVGPPMPEHSLAQIRAAEAARRNPSSGRSHQTGGFQSRRFRG